MIDKFVAGLGREVAGRVFAGVSPDAPGSALPEELDGAAAQVVQAEQLQRQAARLQSLRPVALVGGLLTGAGGIWFLGRRSSAPKPREPRTVVVQAAPALGGQEGWDCGPNAVPDYHRRVCLLLQPVGSGGALSGVPRGRSPSAPPGAACPPPLRLGIARSSVRLG